MNTLPVPSPLGEVRFSPPKTVWLWGTIVIAALLGPSLEPAAVATALALTGLTVCLGHSVGLHRGVIHRAYRMPRALRNALLLLFVQTGLGGPLSWIRLHYVRDHWQNEPAAPPYFGYRHSLVRDFWWNLHCAFVPREWARYRLPARIMRDPFLQRLERTWPLHVLGVAAALALLFGASFVATAVFARVALALLGHWFVGFVAHKYGETRWEIDGSSEVGRNVLVLGWLSFGEGFHNNHHAHPASARMGFRWYEVDLGWCAVRALEKLGWIGDVRAFGRAETRRANAHPAGQPSPSSVAS